MSWVREGSGCYRSGSWEIVEHEHGYCLVHDQHRLLECHPYPTLGAAQAAATDPAEPHRRAVQRYQRRHKALGLCVQCSRPAASQSLCREHLESNRNQARKRTRAEATHIHRCGGCGEIGHNRRTCPSPTLAKPGAPIPTK